MPNPTTTRYREPLVYMDGIEPSDLGLPAKFTRWRHQQDIAIEQSLCASTRFVVQSQPVGAGKSLAYVAEAVYTGLRTAVLTSTKGLQDQLKSDFGPMGLVSVKGRANFECIENPQRTCEDGGHCRCEAMQSGLCPYKQQLQTATQSRLVVTNYAYWAAVHHYGEGMGQFDLLILDEAHDGPEAICSTLDVHLSNKEVLGMLRAEWPTIPAHMESWRQLGIQYHPIAASRASEYRDYANRRGISHTELTMLKDWSNLESKLATLKGMRGEWVAVPRVGRGGGETNGWDVCIVWPRTYSEQVLFRGIPKVVMVSATILPKTMELYGVNRADYTFFSYPYVFPKERSPIYWVPTAKVNHKTTEEEMGLVLERVDEIVGERLDRKGIIHTVSYERARWIVDNSEYAGAMITHTNRNGEAQAAAERFKASKAPSVLVTPSMGTGYDFPYQDSEYQIILKAPYGDHRNPVTRRRSEVDNSYSHFAMAQELIQACGRSMRAEDDQCETFIVDNTVDRIVKWKPGLFMPWWRELYRRINYVPPPPPPLPDRPKR